MRMTVLSLLRWSGFMWFWRFLHRRQVIILTVHGVMDQTDRLSWSPLRPQLSRRRLEACIRMLSKYYRFVTLQDAVEMVTGQRPIRPYSVAITFDDGYRNNIKYALPILRRQSVPATFFLATGHIEQRRPFWFDRLDYALQYASVDGRDIRIGQRTIRLSAKNRLALRDSYKELRDAAKALHRHDTQMLHELESIAALLEEESGRRLADIFEDDDWSAVLTWDEIRGAAGNDVCFGSHTVDHLRLGLLDAETITEQLMRSKQMIEMRTGRPCRFLCYPNGSFNEAVVRIARACGYDAALTTIEGMNRRDGDPMTLRRIGFPEDAGVTETLAVVSGLSRSISNLKGALRTVLPARTQEKHRDDEEHCEPVAQ